MNVKKFKFLELGPHPPSKKKCDRTTLKDEIQRAQVRKSVKMPGLYGVKETSSKRGQLSREGGHDGFE